MTDQTSNTADTHHLMTTTTKTSTTDPHESDGTIENDDRKQFNSDERSTSRAPQRTFGEEIMAHLMAMRFLRDTLIAMVAGFALGGIFGSWIIRSVAIPVAGSEEIVLVGSAFFGALSMIGVFTIAAILAAVIAIRLGATVNEPL